MRLLSNGMSKWFLKAENFLFAPVERNGHSSQVRNLGVLLHDLLGVYWMCVKEIGGLIKPASLDPFD